MGVKQGVMPIGCDMAMIVERQARNGGLIAEALPKLFEVKNVRLRLTDFFSARRRPREERRKAV